MAFASSLKPVGFVLFAIAMTITRPALAKIDGEGSAAMTGAQRCIAGLRAIGAKVSSRTKSPSVAGAPPIPPPRKPTVQVEDAFPSTQPAPQVFQNAPPPAAVRPFKPLPSELDGMVVKEVDLSNQAADGIQVTPQEYLELHDKPLKVIKAKEPPPKAKTTIAPSHKWYRSILDVGDGNQMTVVYKVIETKSSGRVVIEFENPYHRGQLERREVMPRDLLRGQKEIEGPRTLKTNEREF